MTTTRKWIGALSFKVPLTDPECNILCEGIRRLVEHPPLNGHPVFEMVFNSAPLETKMKVALVSHEGSMVDICGTVFEATFQKGLDIKQIRLIAMVDYMPIFSTDELRAMDLVIAMTKW